MMSLLKKLDDFVLGEMDLERCYRFLLPYGSGDYSSGVVFYRYMCFPANWFNWLELALITRLPSFVGTWVIKRVILRQLNQREKKSAT